MARIKIVLDDLIIIFNGVILKNNTGSDYLRSSTETKYLMIKVKNVLERPGGVF